MLQNPELHYLDNAATTMVAPEVADVIDKAMRAPGPYRLDGFAQCSRMALSMTSATSGATMVVAALSR